MDFAISFKIQSAYCDPLFSITYKKCYNIDLLDVHKSSLVLEFLIFEYPKWKNLQHLHYLELKYRESLIRATDLCINVRQSLSLVFIWFNVWFLNRIQAKFFGLLRVLNALLWKSHNIWSRTNQEPSVIVNSSRPTKDSSKLSVIWICELTKNDNVDIFC